MISTKCSPDKANDVQKSDPALVENNASTTEEYRAFLKNEVGMSDVMIDNYLNITLYADDACLEERRREATRDIIAEFLKIQQKQG